MVINESPVRQFLRWLFWSCQLSKAQLLPCNRIYQLSNNWHHTSFYYSSLEDRVKYRFKLLCRGGFTRERVRKGPNRWGFHSVQGWEKNSHPAHLNSLLESGVSFYNPSSHGCCARRLNDNYKELIFRLDKNYQCKLQVILKQVAL